MQTQCLHHPTTCPLHAAPRMQCCPQSLLRQVWQGCKCLKCTIAVSAFARTEEHIFHVVVNYELVKSHYKCVLKLKSHTFIGLLRASCISTLFLIMVWSSLRSKARRSMYAWDSGTSSRI